jgi:hypothetical protein
MIENLKIILLCVAAAIAYGVAHDQITARVCLEYFTVFHPPVFATQSPTALAFGWGVIATWWVGLFLGLLLALAARAGSPQTNGSGATSTNREVTCVDGMLRVVCGFGRSCLGQSRFSCRTRVDNTSLQFLFVSRFRRRSVRPHCVLRQRIFRWNCALRFAVSKADSY